MKMEKKIIILENMLVRMVEGHLGCSGFSMTETDILRFAIFQLKEIKKAKEEVLDKFQTLLDEHRAEFFITCPESCLCWEIDNILMYYAEKHSMIFR